MIPARYKDADYKEHVPEELKVLVREMRNSGRGIYIYGGVGVGKTHVAYAIKAQYSKILNQSGYFRNTAELFREIKDDYDAHPTNQSHIFERLMENNELLVLDDIGSERPSEWVLEQFYLIINKKYNDMTPVIFTSNFDMGEIASRLGDRIASRITGMCNVYHMQGVDRRLEKKSTVSNDAPVGEEL